MHTANDAFGDLPPMCADHPTIRIRRAASAYNWPYGRTLFHWLLPHIEQDNLFKLMAPDIGPTIPAVYANLQFQTVIKTYICPSDSSVSNGKSQTTFGNASTVGASCKAGNFLLFGNPATGHGEGAARLHTISDGTSNTVAFAEAYATCGKSGDIANMAGSLWTDSTSIWRPTFATDGTNLDSSANNFPPKPFLAIPLPWLSFRFGGIG